MNLNSNQKIVAIKAFARANKIPLDASSIYPTYTEALLYAQTSPIGYAGQVISTESGSLYILVIDGETNIGTEEEPILATHKLVGISLGEHDPIWKEL